MTQTARADAGIDVVAYQRVTGVYSHNGKDGGQELILAEIIGALTGCKAVWLPFYSSGSLQEALVAQHFKVVSNRTRHMYRDPWPTQCDAIYFGTPTIVDGKALFPDRESWTKDKERKIVRDLCDQAKVAKARVVCGLGLGDIFIEERVSDIGGGKVIAYKDFGLFQDWVIRADF